MYKVFIMKSKDLRKKYFEYFTKHKHEKVPSSSLIPALDPTLLFTNAGMNQFKDVFLGNEKRSYDKAVSIQKCVRAGGKHNDLDNVGFTKRHLTFFEMMGNFSFGDYFKKEAIEFAWEFLTKILELPKDTLHVTVFETDDESYNIWKNVIGIPEDRIHRCGAKDNFWQMGDIGPCGPCTEIFYDRGPEFGPAFDCDQEGERFLEVWNLVFMQYNRQPNGTDKPLKQTGVDTGMGLERLSLVMQNKDSVFQTDLFTPIIEKIAKLTGVDYQKCTPEIQAAFHVLADHIRSASLLIADGCAPSNEGRGYVLRKIIRRAALFAQKLTVKNIFPELSKEFIKQMDGIYPELKENEKLIHQILNSEIEKFAQNLVRGKQILEQYMQENKASKIITGKQAFKLYDTFGFPQELIIIIANEHGFTVDMEGFAKHMAAQRAQSGKKETDTLAQLDFGKEITTEFTGYEELETPSKIIALVFENKSVDHVSKDRQCWIITKKSPFFIVGGGQVPDKGWLVIDGTKVPIEKVRFINKAIAAKIKAPIDIKIGDTISSIVNKELRINAMKNHTATHLLQAALITLFGKQIKQSGSFVHPDYLRFDFTFSGTLNWHDINNVEDLVNTKIRENIPVLIEYMNLKEAVKKGVLAFFGEKYNPDNVRVVNIPEFSMELCGGTHVERTGDIGTFKITEVSTIAAGHKRIVALTGPKAIELFQETFDTIKKLRLDFKVKPSQVIEAIEKQKEELKKTQTEIKLLKKEQLKNQLPFWLKQVEEINSIPFAFVNIKNAHHDALKDIISCLQDKRPGFYFVTSTLDDRSLFMAGLASKYEKHLNLKNLATWLKENYNLRGGGSKTMLQGGGGKFDPKLKNSLIEWIKSQNIKS